MPCACVPAGQLTQSGARIVEQSEFRLWLEVAALRVAGETEETFSLRHLLAELLVQSCNVGKDPTAYVGQQ